MYVGAAVRRRGSRFTARGVIEYMNGDWCLIEWDGRSDGDSPRICHARELEMVDEGNGNEDRK